MPNLNPLVTGDVAFPQYSVTTTQVIAQGISVTKGKIFTKNASGELVVSTGDLTRGIYQIRETPDPNPGPIGSEVQVLSPRSRMLLQDTSGGLVEGDNVDNTTNTDGVTIAAVTTGAEYVGRVFEIYTKDSTTGSKKKVAAAGDLVVVETVGP